MNLIEFDNKKNKYLNNFLLSITDPQLRLKYNIGGNGDINLIGIKDELENFYRRVNGLYINSRFNFINLIIFLECFFIFKVIFLCSIIYVK